MQPLNPKGWVELAVGEMRNIYSWCCNLLGGDLAIQGLVFSPSPVQCAGGGFPITNKNTLHPGFSIGIEPGPRGRAMFPGSKEVS